MRMAPALNMLLSRVPEQQGAARSVHGRRRLGLLRRAEAQVHEDLLDGYLVVKVGKDLELPRTCDM
jgi:hypothetical protein